MSELIDYQAEARARHDVLLLDDGAHIFRPLGQLVVTEFQYEKARLTRDPLFPVAEYLFLGPSDEERGPAKAWLDESIKDVWRDVYPDDSARIPQALWRNSVRTTRDLLVLGRQKILAIRNFGEKTITHLDDFLQRKNYPLAWKDEPSVEDIADICDSLDEVLGLAVLPAHRSLPAGMSVKGILETPADRRQKELGARDTSSDYLQMVYAKEAYASAEIFAIQFDLVKNSLGEDYWYKEF